MSFCPRCGAERKDDAPFCGACGLRFVPPGPAEQPPEPLAPEEPVLPQVPDVPGAPDALAAEDAPASVPEKKEKKKRRSVLPVLLVLLLLAALAAGGFFVWRQVLLKQQYNEQLAQAQAYIEEGDYDQAIAAFQALIDQNADDEAAREGLRIAQEALRAQQEALHAQQEAALDAQAAQRTADGDARLDAGDFDGAIRLYEEALAIRPEWPQALSGIQRAELGKVRLQLDQIRAQIESGDPAGALQAIQDLALPEDHELYEDWAVLRTAASLQPVLAEADTGEFPLIRLTFGCAIDTGLLEVAAQVEDAGTLFGPDDIQIEQAEGQLLLTYQAPDASGDPEIRLLQITLEVGGIAIPLQGSYETPYRYPSAALRVLVACGGTDSAEYRAMERFAQEVQDASGGRVTVELHTEAPGGGQVAGALSSSGSYTLALVGKDALLSQFPELAALDAPWLFSGADNYYAAMDGALLDWMDARMPGVHPLNTLLYGGSTLFLRGNSVMQLLLRSNRVGTCSPMTHRYFSAIVDAELLRGEASLYEDAGVTAAYLDSRLDAMDEMPSIVAQENGDLSGTMAVSSWSSYDAAYLVAQARLWDELDPAVQFLLRTVLDRVQENWRAGVLTREQQTTALLKTQGVAFFSEGTSFLDLLSSLIPNADAVLAQLDSAASQAGSGFTPEDAAALRQTAGQYR